MSPAARAPRAPRPAAPSPKRTLVIETDWDVSAPFQREVLDAEEQILDVTVGRRGGKSDVGESWLTGIHPYAGPGNNGAVWVPGSRNLYAAPNYRPNCVDMFESLKESLHGLIADKSESELYLKLRHNGATIQCIQLERYEGHRGISYDRLFLDEKGTTAAKAWYNVLAPVLADPPERCLRRVLRAGTPRGKKHWTYREHMASLAGKKGPGPGTRRAITAPTWSRPGTESYVEDMRASLPANVFRQELGAEFLDEAAGYFQKLTYTGEPPPPYHHEGTYTGGLDFAHTDDFSAGLILRARPRVMIPVAVERFQRQPWPETKRRMVGLLRDWNADALIDATPGGAPGEVTVEAFSPEWRRVAGFDSRGQAGAGREDMLMHLAVQLEQEGIKLPGTAEKPYFPQLTVELEGFEYELLPSGRARASAGVGPDGERLQDDLVIVLALAAWRSRTVGGYVRGLATL